MKKRESSPPERFEYAPWRHGGWYVTNVQYPNGAWGCVSRNYEDGKWRVVCDPRPFEKRPTFKTRDEAARAEWWMADTERRLRLYSVSELDKEIVFARACQSDGAAQLLWRHQVEEEGKRRVCEEIVRRAHEQKP